ETTATMIGFLGPIPETQEEELRALGFVPRRDKIGYAGLEVFYEELLRGTPGRQVVEVDVAGQVLRDLEAPIAPQPGLNLVLTIDTRLQQAADQIMKYEIETWTTYFGYLRISSGVAIAMNPRTGEILAMVSYPTYQNNRLARFIPAYYYEQLISDATQPLLNHAVGAELPAGSVFKLVTSVGALNEGVVTPTQIIQTPGQITIQERYFEGDQGKPRPFVDWKAEGFGQLDFLGGISNSSNVYFYKLGGGYPGEIPDGGLGICRIGTYARALGYGAELGIELPDEANGLIPNPTWKRINLGENWSTGDTYISAVGQGLVISTPLQVLMSAAVVANNGVLVRPTLVREVVDGEGNVIQAVVDENGNPIPNAVIDDFGNITNIVLEQGSRRVEIEVNVRGEVLSVAVEGRRGVVGVIMDNDDRILNYVTDDFRNIKQISRDTRGRITEIELAANSSRVDIILNNDGKVSSVAMQDEKNVVALLLDEETQFVVGLIEGERNHGDLYVSSPFYPDVKWDLTKDPLIQQFEDPGGIGSCKPTGDYTTVQSWVFKKIQEGMRLVVTHGTLNSDDTQFSVPAAGKTGTAEYCDAVALSNNRCNFGNWPTHSWTVAYAPFENPEIVVVAFMYNGGEGASVAGPVVRKIVDAYFELRAIDAALGNP
ncbi:MAG: penicillin-binding transpeptidase domain-containing protein, partial [Anaerolineae bacterium]|nr:penicillin-binding transpeptidase domain-containing protein [Anaerolineae bacterium]